MTEYSQDVEEVVVNSPKQVQKDNQSIQHSFFSAKSGDSRRSRYRNQYFSMNQSRSGVSKGDFNENPTFSSSIPSKYQHVLFLRKKFKGFNSSSDKHSFKKQAKRRFNCEPGPATYRIKPPKLRNYSKKHSSGVSSRGEMYTFEETSPGPCDYETTKPKNSICTVKYKKSSPNIKALEGDNPLSYVLPLTVNLFFKKNFPGPGEYSPQREIEDHVKNEYSSAFNSKSQRRFIINDKNNNFLKYSFQHKTIEEEMNKNLEKLKKRESKETPHKTISSSLITTKNRTRGNLSQDFANLGERLKTIQEHCGNQSFR
ncbi:unnamed protein product [Moneuplotes crassus]|uniref:Uncharacterized protein n=1 Tax=Euplotes crassus TaxID=5936 RepID=A0AAD1UQ76_EUPCR|nr:unnamed protein product [Moneuplotes crassus]